MHIFTFKNNNNNNNKQTNRKQKQNKYPNPQIEKHKYLHNDRVSEEVALVHSSTKLGMSCMEDRCQPCSFDEVICIRLFNRVSANLPSHHNRAAIFFNYI